MASIFPAVVHYEQDFISNNMKQTQLERTVDGQKQKSQIPQFTGDSVEMLLYTQQRFNNSIMQQIQRRSIQENGTTNLDKHYMETPPTLGKRS